MGGVSASGLNISGEGEVVGERWSLYSQGHEAIVHSESRNSRLKLLHNILFP